MHLLKGFDDWGNLDSDNPIYNYEPPPPIEIIGGNEPPEYSAQPPTLQTFDFSYTPPEYVAPPPPDNSPPWYAGLFGAVLNTATSTLTQTNAANARAGKPAISGGVNVPQIPGGITTRPASVNPLANLSSGVMLPVMLAGGLLLFSFLRGR